MLANWLGKWRINRRCRRFWQLLSQGEVPQALATYDSELASSAPSVSRQARAAYHLHRWATDHKQADMVALRDLARESSTNSAVATAWQTAQQWHRQWHLAKALWAVMSGQKANAIPQVPAAERAENQAMESLGLATLATLACDQGCAGRTDDQTAARQALRLIQEAPEDTACRSVHSHVLAWACQVTGDHARTLNNLAEMSELPEPAGRQVPLAAATALAKSKLAANDARAAVEAMARVEDFASCDVWILMVLAVGQSALDGGAVAPAAEWFSLQMARTEAGRGETRALWGLAMATALFRDAQYAQARKTASATAQLPPAAGQTQVQSPLFQEVRSQAVYLVALSWLAATHEWAAPSGEDPVLAVKTKVKNRSLWGGIRPHIDDVLKDLAECGQDLAWRSHLLAGLVAYIDSSIGINLAGIDRFSAAVERLESASARTALKAIEGLLITQAKATDEAIELVRKGNHRHLRQLKETVLADLGDAIPALVRATVYLTLWEADQTYDPLPDLKVIPVGAADEALIGQCISHVQVVHSLGELCRQCLGRASGAVIPPLEPIGSFDAVAMQRATLAAAVVKLRAGAPQAAQAMMDRHRGEVDSNEAAAIRFRLAWQRGDAETCRTIAAGEHGSLIRQDARWSPAVAVVALRRALEQNHREAAWQQLKELSGPPESPALLETVVRLTVFLMERRQADLAYQLVGLVRHELEGTPTSEAGRSMDWALLALDGPVAAQQGRYSACPEAVDRLLAAPAAPSPVFGSAEADAQVLCWNRLIKIEAELALAAEAAVDVKVRWRSVQRTLAENSEALGCCGATQPYEFLLSGLSIYLLADMRVDEEVISRLKHASDVLSLSQHGQFLQQVIGRLDWRRNVINAFWKSIAGNDLKEARFIYKDELLPTFGERMPHSIQLGMVIVNCDARAATKTELLDRLEVLRHEAPDLSAELIDKARDYVLESDKIHHLVALLRNHRYEELVEQIDRLTWVGLAQGAMPLPVAIGQLYACFKLKRTEQALAMGEQIAGDRNYPQWVIDSGAMLWGYILFDQKKYPEAAVAFERISSSQMLGHDTDKYWAAAQFNQGLQLLEVGQEGKAFEVFGRSLAKAVGSKASSNLVPLFIHFALKAIDSRNGEQARQSFELMSKSLEGTEDSAQKRASETVALMGQLLCRVLMEEDVAELSGKKFIELWNQDTDVPHEPPDERTELERTLRILAVCQELRRQFRLRPERRLSPPKLATFLRKEIVTLEPIQEQLKRQDPVLLVLKGLVDFLLVKGKSNEAIAVFEQAIRLGVQSRRLIALLDRFREKAKKATGQNTRALDLFDLYLASGTVPMEIRDQLVRQDDVAHLYRVSRNYRPSDVLADDIQPGVDVFCNRLEDLARFIASDSFENDKALPQMAAELNKQVELLRATEKGTLEVELTIMKRLAERLRARSAETV